MPPNNMEMPPHLVRPSDRPGANVATDTGPRLPPDRLTRRLLWAGLISILVNAALWRVTSQVMRRHILEPPPPLIFKRVILPSKPKPPKKIIRKVIPPKLKPIVTPRPASKPRPVVPHRVLRPKPEPGPPPATHARPALPAAHHRLLTTKGTTPIRQTALSGGHAQLGQPIAQQKPDEGQDNSQPPAPPSIAAIPAPSMPPTPVSPKPVPPPPAGPTQDAQPANQAYPEIPDELKIGDYKSSVRVKVDIAATGSFSVGLLTSSGNEEIDGRVLDALKRWKWKPALQNGQPVASTQRFRFNFEVH